jgi:DNA-binding transcriptional LysR family regulator
MRESRVSRAPWIPKSPGDLVHHDVISFDSVSSPSVWTFEQRGKPLEAMFKARLSVNTIDAAIDAGLYGAGLIRTVSYQVAEQVRDKRLVVVLANSESMPRPVHLVYDRQGRLPLKPRPIIDFVVPRLRKQLSSAVI